LNSAWRKSSFEDLPATSKLRRTNASYQKARLRIQLEELEPRLAPASFAVNAQLQVSRLDNIGDPPAGAQAVVFLESTVADYQVLCQGLGEETDCVVLDATGDGLREMEAFLADHHGLSAIGVVTHGAPGVMTLGTLALDASRVTGHAQELAVVGSALSRGGEIDLWSCQVAAGTAGETLVRDLALATGAGVGASDQLIGSAGQGGNWQLDVQLAGARGQVPFSSFSLESYPHVLGGADPSQSTVTATPASIPLGGTAMITLTAKNAAGVPITSGGLPFNFNTGAGTGSGTFSDLVDNNNGTYSAQFTGTKVGAITITATLNGQPITSVLPAVRVTPATTTAVNSTPNPSIYGQPVTFTATVTSGAAPVTAGTVTFEEGSTILASNVNLDASGHATFSIATLSADASPHLITALYSGNLQFSSSAGTTSQTVNPRPITVTADAQSKPYGAADPVLTYQITAGALLPGDAFSGTLSRAPGDFPGTYAINQGTLTLGDNYALTYVGANLVVMWPTQLVITNLSSTSVTAGDTVTFTVTAEDSLGRRVSGFIGTVWLRSTDGAATTAGNPLPAAYFFARSDQGSHTFTVTLATAGTQEINVGSGSFSQVATTDPIMVALGPAKRFLIALPSSNAIVVNSPFSFTVQATDLGGNTVSNYTGPQSVTITTTPADALGDLPITGSLNSSGYGLFTGTLRTAASYVLTATAGTISGTSDSIAVTAEAATHFTLTAPSAVSTGGSTSITVVACDPFGNTATGYSGSVHFTSSAASAILPSDATLNGGRGTFSVTLNAPGNQTITATDTLNPAITGTSGPITTRGLTVTSVTPAPTGFIASFSKPFVPADLTLYGAGLHTVQDVTLVGAHVGAINGSLVIDPSNMSLVFKATVGGLSVLNDFGPVVLPDDTYTVTMVSGTGSNGFIDPLGAGLDGTNTGGHAKYTTTFTTHYQASATPILAIPDFARGPDDAHSIKVPNDSAQGIPITLYNASKVTDVTFSLSYSPMLFSVSGGANGDATDPASTLTLVGVTTDTNGSHATATFHFQDKTPQSGTVVLGDIVATVPGSAAALYKSKELLQLNAIVINQGRVTGAVSAGGVHVNAYSGDVTGDGKIDGLDVATASTVALGTATGFGAYTLLDPAIVGDVANDLAVDAGDISDLASYTVRLPTPMIPTPASGSALTAVGADAGLASSGGPLLQNGSFALPAITANSYFYNPPNVSWSYSAQSGVSTNGSAITSGNPPAPTTQVAFLQGTGDIEQKFTVMQSGFYVLSFQLAQAANVQTTGYEAIDVFVDDPFGARHLVGVCLPTSTQFSVYTTQSFALTGGTQYTLALQGIDPLGANLPAGQQDIALLTGVQLSSTTINASQSGPAVLAQAIADFTGHGSINYNDMVGLLNGVAAIGTLTSTEMQCLQTVLANATPLNIPDFVADLASKVINGDPANTTFQTLDASGNVVTTNIGNLQIGSPGSLVDDLVRRWFLGENYPVASAPYGANSGAVLFGNSGPSYGDVFQGGLGDCTLMATLAEVAARDSGVIQNMFVPLGSKLVNGTTVDIWAVRFYDDGVPTYVTVDSELPGGSLYDHPAGGVIWAALAEKAYAELNQAGWLPTLSRGENTYQALGSGTEATAVAAMAAITGLASSGINTTSNDAIATMEQGQLVVMCTGNAVADATTFVTNHCYAVLGYDATSGLFTLFNPWGVNSQQDFGMPAIVTATAPTLVGNFFALVQEGASS
jgi:hypothetical protein